MKGISDAQLEAAWKRALDTWGLAIHVDVPTLDRKSPAIAYIDLETREVVVNPDKVAQLDALDCLDAILAHELGHHLRYPASLAVQARLELLERELLPVRGYSLLNLFSDFLINTDLGRTDTALRAQLARVYQGMPVSKDSLDGDVVFFFYLTCFEEAWFLAPHTLTRAAGPELEKRFPGVRAEAQVLAQELPNLAPNLFTQFIYFASIFSRYQMVDEEQGRKKKGPSGDAGKGASNPHHGDHSSPSAGDYADALRRGAQESEAIRRAIAEGWLDPATIPDQEKSEKIRAGMLPGVLAGKPKVLAEAMALHYRRLAERHLVKIPPETKEGEPFIPSTLSPWEVGDSPKEIDWISSITAGGADLGAISPLKRDYIPDDPQDLPRDWRARLEIYLDVSGSMPDPKSSINPMTLAAQVLAMSAIRAGGQVRAVIYSTNHVEHWTWTRSETVISRFLMNYIGGGTDFPFAMLKASIETCGHEQPIRVVLTDGDFHYNLKAGPDRPKIVGKAAERGTFIALLNGAQNAQVAWVKEIADAGARVVPVPDMEGFPKVAAALGDALFGENAPGARRSRRA